MKWTTEIAVEQLTIDCIVGAYPAERLAPQPLCLDVFLHVEKGADPGEDLNQTIDYSLLARQLKFLWIFGKFSLLETGCAVSLRLLKAYWHDRRGARIKELSVSACKPKALGGSGIPRVMLTVPMEGAATAVEKTKFGYVDILHESDGKGIYLLNVAPGKGIARHFHHVMRETEMAFDEGLLLQGRPLAPFAVHAWPQGFIHTYSNPTDGFKTIACIDEPKFSPSDEIEVEEESADREPPAPIIIL